MKKVSRRALFALALAAILAVGTLAFCVKYAVNAEKWVTFSGSPHVYTGTNLTGGKIYDRSGVRILNTTDGRVYSGDTLVREATVHLLGDRYGYIRAPLLGVYAEQMIGYDKVTGLSSASKGEASARLTISAELQAAALQALGSYHGTVGIYNYKTGEVLCMVSGPSIDPAVDGDVPDGAYINRCINGSFTPGSIYKLITSAAALENIKDIDSRRFSCAGSVDVGGVTVKCTGVHGSQTFEDALANSCNCAFAQISLELGADTIESYAKKLGFLDSQSLSGIPTMAGSFTKGASGSANLAWSGIGQYEDLICPYSMLRYVSAIANGGSVVEPSLLLDTPSGSSTTLLSAATANKLRDMMNYNVSAHYGTNRFPGLNLCAKTGTAEVGDGTSHAWFTGFLLDDAHPYAFVVLVENAGGGLTNAGAVANTVLQAAVNK